MDWPKVGVWMDKVGLSSICIDFSGWDRRQDKEGRLDEEDEVERRGSIAMLGAGELFEDTHEKRRGLRDGISGGSGAGDERRDVGMGGNSLLM